MNWTEILAKAGVPDSPGYHETVARVKAKPPRPKKKPKPKKR